jgi:hypothetical protein
VYPSSILFVRNRSGRQSRKNKDKEIREVNTRKNWGEGGGGRRDGKKMSIGGKKQQEKVRK